MHPAPEILFAQKLAANEKRIRDRAVKKLKKWLYARSSSEKFQLSKEEILKLWKGLFYCMWMSDKPLIQEELAKTISEMIHCFNKRDATLLFIKEFFETMNREWQRIDYLRMDKFMMFVRCFLHEVFEFLRKSGWDDDAKDSLLDALDSTVINPKLDDSCIGLQLHVADIYVEELVKVAADELTGNQLTKLLIPYCHLLATCRSPVLRKTVIQRVFEFTMRLSDSDDESVLSVSGDGPENENVEVSNSENQVAEENSDSEDEMDDDDDDELVGSSLDEDDEVEGRHKIYRKFEGDHNFLKRVKKHEIKTLKLPIPEFDYQDIGDTLFEIVGNAHMKQKLRSENYSLIKKFHEMARGIFPLDLVDKALGRRLCKKDIESAAKRLLMEREEEMQEDASSHPRRRKRALLDESFELEEVDILEEEEEEEDSDPKNSEDTLHLQSPDKKQVKRQKPEKKDKSFKTRESVKVRTKNSPNTTQETDSTKISIFNDTHTEDLHSITVESAEDDISVRKCNEDAAQLGSPVIKKVKNQTLKKKNGKSNLLKKRTKVLNKTENPLNAEPETFSTQNSCVIDTTIVGSRFDTVENPVKVNETESDREHTDLKPHLKSEDKTEIRQTDRIGGKNVVSVKKKENIVKTDTVSQPDDNAASRLNNEDSIQPREAKAKKSRRKIILKKKRKQLKNQKINTSTSEQQNDSASCSFICPEITSVTDKDKAPHYDAVKCSGESSKEEVKVIANSESKSKEIVRSPLESCNRILTRKRKKDAMKEQCGNMLGSNHQQVDEKCELKSHDLSRITAPFTQAHINERDQQHEDPSEKLRSPGKKRIKLTTLLEGDSFRKQVKKKVTGNEFIKFEEFVKTPPAFFRKAVSKISPKTLPKAKKAESKLEELSKSCKKVNFKLMNNSTQGTQDYVASVKNSPGIPYDANKLPAQGVLKSRPSMDSSNKQKHPKNS